jgi:RHS repeat-associated protein
VAGLAPVYRSRAWRRLRGAARNALATILGPVVTVGGMALPSGAMVAAGVAGVTAAAVATGVAAAPAARAATPPGKALVLLQNGESTAPETTALQAVGWTVDQATPAQWLADSASTFKSYAVLVIGDPSTTSSCSALTPTTATSGTDAIGTTWQSAVSGNVAVLGTAPAAAGSAAASSLVTASAGYAAAGYSSSAGTGTGLYVSLNCEYKTAAAKTAVPLLAGVEGIGAAGGLSVQGGLSCSDGGTVNKWEAGAAGTFGAVTSGSLGTGSWTSPGCPVQEAFSSWPAMFTPAAFDAAPDATANFTASDGVSGQPYVLLGQPVSSATAALAPGTGGEVPASSAVGGSNPAAPGVNQATAGDPVDTENGDFTQAATDLSVPGFGPALDFSRTYDAQLARQQTVAGTPGPLGYGWTDNWATSLTLDRPVPGDIYTISTTGVYPYEPVDMVSDAAGDVLYVDATTNDVVEVATATHTQFGISMTAGHAYVIAGSSSGASGNSGDGGPATSALLNTPWGLALDGSGNLFIADQGNNRIQEVPAASGTQFGISMTANDMYTVAGSATGATGSSGDGGPATSATMVSPAGLAVDAAGDLYTSDDSTGVVREVPAATGTQWGRAMTANDIYTVAGSAAGTGGSSGDGGPATAAELNGPQGLGVDAAGDLYIGDTYNNRLQEVPVSSGTQWGQSMTAGDVYTVIGSSMTAGDTGDGGPATAAELNWPAPVAFDPSGNMLIPDAIDSEIREVFATTSQLFTTSPAGTGITVNQADGSQVTFYPKNSAGTCTAPYVAASGSGYCTLPQDVSASLTDNSSAGTYTYTPSPGTSYVYSASTGALKSESDTAGDTLTVTAASPSPGSGNCPSTASSCTTITAASGRALVLGYNSAGLVTSATDPLGRRWAYAYNAASQLTSATDPLGNVTTYTYGADSTGNPQLSSDLLTITSPNAQPGGPDAGDSTVNVYDSQGRVTSQTDPMGNATTFNYCVSAAAGDCLDPATGTGLVTVSDPDGNKTVYSYQQGTLASTSQFTGTTLTSETDQQPNTTSGTLQDATSTDGDGNTTTDTYSAASYITQESAPAATGTATTTSGYATGAAATADQANCTSTAEASSACQADSPPAPVAPGGTITPPSTAPPVGTTYTLYDTDGNELYATTGVYEPGATSAAYSRTTYQLFKGNTVTLSGTTVSCTATPPSQSLPCAKINADGVVTQLAYDSAGDLTSSATPDGNGSQVATTTHAYDGDGEQTGATSPDGNLSGANAGNYTTVTAYNAAANETAQTAPAPAGQSGYETTSYAYDSNGNLVQVTAPPTVSGGSNQVTVDTYTPAGQVASETTGNGTSAATVSYCYDPNGDKTAVVYADGNTSGTALCESSSPWVVSSSAYPTQAGYQTTYAYDSAGEQVSVTTPASAAASSGATTTKTYDAVGNTLTSIDPDGVTTTWTYTPLLSIATVSYSGSSAHSVSYGYDANGSKTSMSDATGSSSYTYDPFGELTSTTNGAGQATGYGYNADGQPTSVTYPLPSTATWASTDTVSYTYDHASEMTGVTDFNGNQVAVTSTADGSPDSVSLGSTGDSITTTYSAAGDASGISLKNSSGTALQSFSYSDSAAGTILSETDTPSSALTPADYTYDAKGRVTSMTPGSGSADDYSFDASGNLTTLPAGGTGSYNDAGELTSGTASGTSTSYSYNADGERLSAAQAGTTTASATWNGAAQLTVYDNAAADMTAATYDGDGRRATATYGASPQDYVWDELSSLSQVLMDSANAYVYTSGAAPTEQVNLATGSITYLVADSLGSVRGVVSSTGALTATTGYDAWGNPETTGGLTASTPYGYVGGYTDPTGLVYLINRYYDPATGQFTSVDADLSQTLAPFAYADDDPVLNADPTGLDVHEPVCTTTGGWRVTVCVETEDTWYDGKWEALVTFQPKSGSILKIAASSIGMNVCGENAGVRPKSNNSCPQAEVVHNSSASRTTSRSCVFLSFDCTTETNVPTSLHSNSYLSGAHIELYHGELIFGGYNWVHSWENGAWAESTSGQKSTSVSLQGQGYMATCSTNPNANCE